MVVGTVGRVRPPKLCRDCDAPIFYWRNANGNPCHGETFLCVDTSSDDSGTVRKEVSRDDAGRPLVWGRVLSGIDLAAAVEAGEMLFTLHASTCSAKRAPNPKPPGVEIAWPKTSSRKGA